MGVFHDFRWQDVVDMLIIAFVVYQLGLLIRGTRAVPMIIGLVILAAVYQGAQYFELYTVNWILDSIGNVLLIIVVVVFQADIRRMLTQFGTGPIFSGLPRVAHGQVIEELTRAAVTLASRRIGGLIVLPRGGGLHEDMEGGTRLDPHVAKELLQGNLLPSSPL